MRKIAIIGAGKVGTALGYLLQQKGYQLVGITSRDVAKGKEAANFIGTKFFAFSEEILKKGDCFFLTTSDTALGEVAEKLAPWAKKGDFFLHCSGALPAEIMFPLKKNGAFLFSLHPLQTFATAQTAVENLPGSFFAGQGDQEILSFVKQVVSDLEGEFFLISQEEKSLYHAGACVACNYLVALLNLASQMYQEIGFPAQKSLMALLPLVKGTISNVEKLGSVQALTGPIARGDANTINKHLHSLAQIAPHYEKIYQELGLYTLQVAQQKGTLSEQAKEKIKNILQKGR